MAYLFTDMDNTLIHSYRHPIEEPIVWIEQLDGKNHSYMTRRTYHFLKKLSSMTVIPVTTRCPVQFSRLQPLLNDFGWRYSLVCNGAILLDNEKEDGQWSDESRKIAKDIQSEYNRALKAAENSFPADSVISDVPYMFYIRTTEPVTVSAWLRCIIDNVALAIHYDSKRVYCMPEALSKGAAVKRYRERFGDAACIAAGDSDFDISMLNEADIAIFPEALNGKIKKRKTYLLHRNLFGQHLRRNSQPCAGMRNKKRKESIT